MLYGILNFPVEYSEEVEVVVKISAVEKLLPKLFETKKISIQKAFLITEDRNIFNSYDVIKVYHQHGSHMI